MNFLKENMYYLAYYDSSNSDSIASSGPELQLIPLEAKTEEAANKEGGEKWAARMRNAIAWISERQPKVGYTLTLEAAFGGASPQPKILKLVSELSMAI